MSAAEFFTGGQATGISTGMSAPMGAAMDEAARVTKNKEATDFLSVNQAYLTEFMKDNPNAQVGYAKPDYEKFKTFVEKSNKQKKEYEEYLAMQKESPGRKATILTTPNAKIANTILGEPIDLSKTVLGG